MFRRALHALTDLLALNWRRRRVTPDTARAARRLLAISELRGCSPATCQMIEAMLTRAAERYRMTTDQFLSAIQEQGRGA